MMWSNIVGGKKMQCALSLESKDDLRFIKDLVEQGKFKVIEELAQAHRYYEADHRKGSVAVRITNRV